MVPIRSSYYFLQEKQGGFALFERRELVRLKPLILFFVIYTAVFILFAVTLKYTFPFLAGFLLALAAQPLINWLRRRLSLRPAPAAAIATLVVYAILFGLLFLAGFWLLTELNRLLRYVSRLTSEDLRALTAPLMNAIAQLGHSVKSIDSHFIEQNQEKIMSIAQNGVGIAAKVAGTLLYFLTSLPAIFTMLIIMIFSTYFFSKDYGSVKGYLVRLFPHSAVRSLSSYSKDGKAIGGRYIGTYLLIYFITFVETLIVFAALGVPYPLVLSIITGIADILPVLGPGTIYIPLSLIYLVTGNFFRAGALFVCWLLITAIRQIIEPKLVSSTINIHPLGVLAAIYFALVAGNFWVLIYCTVLLILYQLLTKDGTLPTLFNHDSEDSPEEKP